MQSHFTSMQNSNISHRGDAALKASDPEEDTKVVFLSEALGQQNLNTGLFCVTLLLPLETSSVSIEGRTDDKLELPFGQAALLGKGDGGPRHIRLVSGHCLAIQMNVAKCEAIRPANGKSIKWSGVTVFPASHELRAFGIQASRFTRNGMGRCMSVSSAVATITFAEVVLIHTSQQYADRTNLSDDSLSMIEDFIGDHLESTIELHTLADLCNMKVNAFAKAFKAKTGTSPYKYVLSRRVSMACDLLRSTGRSIADIAYEVGFSSQSHMTEYFRRSLGTTPGKYRRLQATELSA